LGRYHVSALKDILNIHEDILNMPIADGLKEVLVNCSLTRKQILTFTTEELAKMLAIDKYVASIIQNAARINPTPCYK
jgi:hypothetical protein